MTTPASQQQPEQQQSWPVLSPEELAQLRAAARERDRQQVAEVLALSPQEAARWLAKWLISTDVKRGYSKHDIIIGSQGYAGSLGMVNLIPDAKIEVSRIGPLASWVETHGYVAAGYDHHEVLSLHAIYNELRAEQAQEAEPMQQMSLWGSEAQA